MSDPGYLYLHSFGNAGMFKASLTLIIGIVKLDIFSYDGNIHYGLPGAPGDIRSQSLPIRFLARLELEPLGEIFTYAGFFQKSGPRIGPGWNHGTTARCRRRQNRESYPSSRLHRVI